MPGWSARPGKWGCTGSTSRRSSAAPDIDIVTRTLLAIEMSQHRAGLYAPCYNVFGGAGLAQLFEADADQKERFLFPTLRGEKKTFFGLTEPSGGSDPARAIQTRAVRDGDDWVVNGSKIFISGADRADFGAGVRADRPGPGPRRGDLLHRRDGHPGFPCPAGGAHAARRALCDRAPVRGHARAACERAGGGERGLRDRQRPRLPPAHPLCRQLHRGSRQGAGAGDRICRHPGDLRRQAGPPAGHPVDDRRERDRHPPGDLAHARRGGQGPWRRAVPDESAIAKIVATEASGRVVDRALQIHGGYGVTKDLPFERWYREMRIRRIGEGPNEVQRHIVARDLFGSSLR